MSEAPALCADGRAQVSAVVRRLRDRRVFVELARRGRRLHGGAVTVLWLADASDGPPQVAYAVGRRVGTAVVRNRVKRQLRAVMHDLGPTLPAGAYLVRATPQIAALSFEEMRSAMARALAALSGSPRPGAQARR